MSKEFWQGGGTKIDTRLPDRLPNPNAKQFQEAVKKAQKRALELQKAGKPVPKDTWQKFVPEEMERAQKAAKQDWWGERVPAEMKKRERGDY